MSDENTILVYAGDTGISRKSLAKEIPVETLSENVNIFLAKIESILKKAPEEAGNFKLVELAVTAEVSAKGGLALMGTGIEASAKGGLTFKFQRK